MLGLPFQVASTFALGPAFVSFGKRRNEILQTGTATRVANARYVPAFLDKAMYLAAAVTVVFYSSGRSTPVMETGY